MRNHFVRLLSIVGSAVIVLFQSCHFTTEAFSSSIRKRHCKVISSSRTRDAGIHRSHLELSANKITADLESFVVNILFGTLDKGKSNTNTGKPEDPNKVLAKFTSLVVGNDSDVLSAHDSLERYLRQWAFMLESDKGITTPITSSTQALRRQENKTTQTINESALRSNCIRIMFRPPPRYLSYNEQKDMEKGVLPDRKGAKMDSKSPGGIQFMMQSFARNNQVELILTATRCGIDNDTIIKTSSERAIIRRLKYAIGIWQKARIALSSRDEVKSSNDILSVDKQL